MSTSTTKAEAGAKGAQYHLVCTGEALATVEAHTEARTPADGGDALTLFGANFCPFVHRAWMVLEVLGAEYRYFECDPYKKPAELLALNPKGLVPALQIGSDPSNGLGESTVIIEYLLERFDAQGGALLPPLSDPLARAKARLASDIVNRQVIPAFYRYLQSQDASAQSTLGLEFLHALEAFVGTMPSNSKGPFWGGEKLGLPDVMIAPWAWRAKVVLKHFRGFDPDSLKSGRYAQWLHAVASHPAFKATTSTDELYLDSYARYAENRPKTSQVADAINSGRALP